MSLKLCQAVPQFSDNLVPDPDFEQRGKKACKRVFQLLQDKRRDVAESVISGSMGKRTAVSFEGMKDPDFDLVVSLNISNPQEFSSKSGAPFETILQEFEKHFRDHSDSDIIVLNTQGTNFIGIQVDGFKLDVAPAIMFKNMPRPLGLSPEEHQKKKTLALIESLSSPWKFGHYYSPGLAEAAVDYVKREGARLNAHPLIRLAKFWNRSLQLPAQVKYTIGQSYLMERVALDAAEELAENFGLVFRLERFLELMSNFSSIEIFQPWPKINWESNGNSSLNSNTGPFILDPVNPYNNIALLHHDPNVRRIIINSFEAGAKKCLQKLRTVKQRETHVWLIQNVDEVKNILDQSQI